MRLGDVGVAVEGVHFARIPHQYRAGDTHAVNIELVTHNPAIFTLQYDNGCRAALHSMLYDTLGDVIGDGWIDASVRLEPPFGIEASPLERLAHAHGLVDVTRDTGFQRIALDDAIRKGDLHEGGSMASWCRGRGANMLLYHGGHYVSPDPITTEIIDTLCTTRPVSSVLEIGAGTGMTAVTARKYGAETTFIERDPEVCAYLNDLGIATVIEGDAFRTPIRERYDVISIGIPYEFVPWLLEQKGRSLRCDTLVIQSGCPAFFQFEHDWLMGRITTWPWHRHAQEVGAWFADPREVQFGYQTAIVAGKGADALVEQLERKGFSAPAYERVPLASVGEARDVLAALRDRA